MGLVPIKGLFETHLTVRDLDRSIAFYRDVVGLELAHTEPKRHAAFFWVGRPRQTMLGLWSIHTSPLRLRLHIAFDAELADVEASVARLRAAGLVAHSGSGAPIDEPWVFAWVPAASVYFDDPDGHALEYIAVLPQPPRPDWGRLPLSQWRARVANA